MLQNEHSEVLDNAGTSNPYWFKALLGAAKVQADRREKYSGGDFENDDPYTNFITVALLMGLPVREVFKFYIAQKVARLMVSDKDFDDERYQDTLQDLANYALLAAGWEGRNDDAKAIISTIKETLSGLELFDFPFQGQPYEYKVVEDK